MGCFVVTEFLMTTASRGPSAIAEPLVGNKQVNYTWFVYDSYLLS